MPLDQGREILESWLRRIDRRRSELEMVMNSLPPDTHCCGDPRREEVQLELSDLWRRRVEICKKLRPSPVSTTPTSNAMTDQHGL
jgi:hypothetical protein